MTRRAINQTLGLNSLNSAVTIDLVLGEATVGFDVRGLSGSGAQLVLETTGNNADWSQVAASNGMQTISADGAVLVATGGAHAARIRVSRAAASGSAYVSYVTSAAALPPGSTFATTVIDTVALAAANTAQQLPSVPMSLGGSIQNQSGDTVFIGTSAAVTSGGAHGWKLVPGQVLGVAASNLNAFWVNGPTAGDVLAYAVN